MNVDPRARVLYLAAIAIGVFLVKSPIVLGALFALQALLWLGVGLGGRRLVRQIAKLWGFAALILISYAITGEDPSVDRWAKLTLLGASFSINVGGLQVAGLMLLRVLTVIVGSQVARAGDPRAIASGLASLGVPRSFAAGLDAVLALLGDGGGGGGGGGGRGDGSGGGRRRREHEHENKEGIVASFRRIVRGDVGPIRDRIARHIARAESHLGGSRDAAIVAGLALTMLSIKALKILPSVPIAPGHKLVLLTPLYIAAALMTKSRLGATWTGLTMGVCAFLLGDGKFGVFEIVKHVTPGFVCDALVPIFAARSSRLAWTIVGALSGAARFATIFVVTLAVQPPAVAFAFLIPGMLIHTTFGAISGFVSHPLVSLLKPPEAPGQGDPAPASASKPAAPDSHIKETA